ncbi:hypothetical protein OG883_45740 [Streptomyces sp. NBC_01142]|nr:hypothetical protein [Streptomyces sp. NBC_01142]MCX4826943.1 hypothetical protein [Streptomyces sp. NBC_01142]
METRKPNPLRKLARTAGWALLRGTVTGAGALAVQLVWQWLSA